MAFYNPLNALIAQNEFDRGTLAIADNASADFAKAATMLPTITATNSQNQFVTAKNLTALNELNAANQAQELSFGVPRYDADGKLLSDIDYGNNLLSLSSQYSGKVGETLSALGKANIAKGVTANATTNPLAALEGLKNIGVGTGLSYQVAADNPNNIIARDTSGTVVNTFNRNEIPALALGAATGDSKDYAKTMLKILEHGAETTNKSYLLDKAGNIKLNQLGFQHNANTAEERQQAINRFNLSNQNYRQDVSLDAQKSKNRMLIDDNGSLNDVGKAAVKAQLTGLDTLMEAGKITPEMWRNETNKLLVGSAGGNQPLVAPVKDGVVTPLAFKPTGTQSATPPAITSNSDPLAMARQLAGTTQQPALPAKAATTPNVAPLATQATQATQAPLPSKPTLEGLQAAAIKVTQDRAGALAQYNQLEAKAKSIADGYNKNIGLADEAAYKAALSEVAQQLNNAKINLARLDDVASQIQRQVPLVQEQSKEQLIKTKASNILERGF